MAQKTKLKPETNSSGTKESSNNQSRSGDKLSMSGQLQITNLGQIQTQLDSLTKKRFVELEVKLTGEGADILKNPQIRTGSINIQTNTASSNTESSRKQLLDSSAQGRALLALSNSFAKDAGEGLNAPFWFIF
ncbi:hypothetical protein MUB23_11590 [Cuneatibacter sp. NSJ-177]|uniref:hypothetical protein n=1 Tax=Cuneatibacter sp. NSJ-177 TaxID=2931401 RepID=UPI001FD249F1|nr:hypothetical protein [Cuneatibacter sp. NSJ-177]MCJ7836024.1 hypothetical protein [Cuneatibacter sp. NSJ-177]